MFNYDADLRGTNLDSSEAIEFLCLAEGGEVTHYEVLARDVQEDLVEDEEVPGSSQLL